MSNERDVLAVFERANPVPDPDHVSVERDAGRYLAELLDDTVMIDHDVAGARSVAARRGWMLPSVAAAVIVVCLIGLIMFAGRDPNSLTPAGVTPTTLPTSQVTEPPVDTSPDSGEGVYVWESDAGAVVRFSIPAPADNETVAAIEQLRTDIGTVGEASYVLAEIDNTAGSEPTNPRLVISMLDSEQVFYDPAWLLLGRWQQEVPSGEADLKKRTVDMFKSLDSMPLFVEPGAKMTQVYAASSALPSVARVWATEGFLGEPVELSRE